MAKQSLRKQNKRALFIYRWSPAKRMEHRRIKGKQNKKT